MKKYPAMPDGLRWAVAVWALLLLSLFLFAAYSTWDWGLVPAYIALLSALLLTQEAMLKAMKRQDKENRQNGQPDLV